MAQLLSLESFEDALGDDACSSEDFKQGYQEGLEAGLAMAAADTAALNETFVQSISNIDFTYAEARGQVLASLKPLLSEIVAKIMPHCVATGFAGQLAQILQQAATDDCTTAITLHIHPSQRDAVALAVKQTTAQITIYDDASLNVHAAWIKQNQQETLLDVDNLLAAISETLGVINHTENRTVKNG